MGIYIDKEEIQKIKSANRILNRKYRQLGLKPMDIIPDELPAPESQAKQSQTISKKAQLIGRYTPLLLLILILTLVFAGDLFAGLTRSLKSAFVKPEVITEDGRELEFLIVTGNYLNLPEAQKARRSIKELTGASAKIIKLDKFYTIQIGPSFNSMDDSFVVYKELVKFSIEDLSIQSIDRRK